MDKQETATADILSTLVVLNRGRFIIECGKELQELTDSIIDTGKKGKLKIALEVTPSGLKDGRISQVDVRPEITIEKPKHDQGKSIFFVTQANQLVQNDPNQMGMDFEQERERETNGRR